MPSILTFIGYETIMNLKNEISTFSRVHGCVCKYSCYYKKSNKMHKKLITKY